MLGTIVSREGIDYVVIGNAEKIYRLVVYDPSKDLIEASYDESITVEKIPFVKPIPFTVKLTPNRYRYVGNTSISGKKVFKFERNLPPS